jgi:hypothetical protein
MCEKWLWPVFKVLSWQLGTETMRNFCLDKKYLIEIRTTHLPNASQKHYHCANPVTTNIVKEIRGCIQKFMDWVDNEINNNNKHSLRSNTKGYGGKTH